MRVWVAGRWARQGLSRKLFAVQSQVRPHYTRGRVSGRGEAGVKGLGGGRGVLR